MVPRRLVNSYGRFGGAYCFQLQLKSVEEDLNRYQHAMRIPNPEFQAQFLMTVSYS
jgi:hypothetical protein